MDFVPKVDSTTTLQIDLVSKIHQSLSRKRFFYHFQFTETCLPNLPPVILWPTGFLGSVQNKNTSYTAGLPMQIQDSLLHSKGLRMSFTNEPVRELPAAIEPDKRPLAKNYAWLVVALWAVGAAALLVAPKILALMSKDSEFAYTLPLLLAIALGCVCIGLYLWFHARHKFFAVREHDVTFFSGIVFKRVLIQPYSRLQHVEINRGPLERLFGLATLKLYSAGSNIHTLAIPGLPNDLAAQLKEYILGSKGLSHGQ